MQYQSTRDARTVVILMILLVGVPSVLLTGLGVVAIRNEEMAARQRLTSVYKPVVTELTRAFDESLDGLLEDVNPVLAELGAWSRDPGGSLAPDTEVFRRAGLLSSFFVVAPSGDVLLPMPAGRPPHRRIPERLRQAIQADLDVRGPAGPCLAIEGAFEDVSHGEDEEDYHVQPVGVDLDPSGCLQDLARAFCPAGPDLADWSYYCGDLATLPAVQAGFDLAAASRGDYRLASVQGPARVLNDYLQDPAQETPPVLAQVLARLAVARLTATGEPSLPPPGESLRKVAHRASLLQHLPDLWPGMSSYPAVYALRTDDWQRVVVARRFDDLLVGAELITPGFDEMLLHKAQQRGLDGLVPLVSPIDKLPRTMETGHSAEDALTGGDHVIAGWGLLDATESAWKLVLRVEGDEALGSLRHSRSGTYLWALVLGSVALAAGIVLVLRAVLREARHSRLRTDFVSSVSHDLRTPLTSIRMFTETLLLGRAGSPEEARECLEVIGCETERLTRLTERILDFSRMEAGRKTYSFEPACVPELVDQALAACRPLLERDGFTFERAIADDLPDVEMDRDAMVEVLINLVSNAIKYSPEERWVRVVAERHGDQIAFAVTDHGLGIPKDEQKRIFEQFHRVDCPRTSEVGGTGIGLSLVRHIVSAHHGRIFVDSKQGRGSTFTVRLPVTQQAS